jgi:peptidoglycan/LPS O-acetylase OafA/YrhL
MSEKRIYFNNFDALRFVAAIVIVFAHAVEGWIGWFESDQIIDSFTDPVTHQESTFGHLAMTFIKNLGIGVELFFVLSGFLITYLLVQEKQRFGKISIPNFFLRRTFRIWPVFYLLIALGPAIVHWTQQSYQPDYVRNALFLGNYDTIWRGQFLMPYAHFWSICVEEHFYIFWPFVVAFVPWKRLPAIMIGIVLLSIGFRAYTFYALDNNWAHMYLNTLSRIDVLIFGAILGYYYARKPFTFTLPIWLRWLLFLALITLMSVTPIYEINYGLEAMFKKYLFVGIIVLLLLDFQFGTDRRLRPFANPVFSYLGKCSYGIYMYSNILIAIIVVRIMWRYQINNMWLFLFFNFALTIGISVISFELFEKRIVKWSHRFRVLK